MSKKDKNSTLANVAGDGELARLGLTLPDDVKTFMDNLFSNCNLQIATQLSTFPNTHEETLDQLLVSNLAQILLKCRVL